MEIIGMNAQQPGALRIISAGFLKCFKDQLPLCFLNGLVILRDLHPRHGLLFEQGFRKVLRLNQFRRPQNHGAFNGVFKFPYVAGSVVLS